MTKISLSKRSLTWLVIIISILLTVSYLYNKNTNTNFVYLEADDPKIIQAKQQALNEIPYFINVLIENSGSSNHDYSIKTDFVENGEREHMWVEVESYKDGYFYGKLGSEPQIVKEFKFHQSVKVKREDVEDWLLHNKTTNTFEGGFSIKALGKWEELTR